MLPSLPRPPGKNQHDTTANLRRTQGSAARRRRLCRCLRVSCILLFGSIRQSNWMKAGTGWRIGWGVSDDPVIEYDRPRKPLKIREEMPLAETHSPKLPTQRLLASSGDDISNEMSWIRKKVRNRRAVVGQRVDCEGAGLNRHSREEHWRIDCDRGTHRSAG